MSSILDTLLIEWKIKIKNIERELTKEVVVVAVIVSDVNERLETVDMVYCVDHNNLF